MVRHLIPGIQQHNIQITQQSAMLESIIKDYYLRVEFLQEVLTSAPAVFINGNRNTRQSLRH